MKLVKENNDKILETSKVSDKESEVASWETLHGLTRFSSSCS